jgi:hypothetical protein
VSDGTSLAALVPGQKAVRAAALRTPIDAARALGVREASTAENICSSITCRAPHSSQSSLIDPTRETSISLLFRSNLMPLEAPALRFLTQRRLSEDGQADMANASRKVAGSIPGATRFPEK